MTNLQKSIGIFVKTTHEGVFTGKIWAKNR